MPNLDFKIPRFPPITIITVTAYESTRLYKTLESLGKIKSDIEHLLVIPIDDDSSEKIIREYSKKVRHSVLISRDLAQGIYPAMNKGINEASGKFLLFLNAGDKIKDTNQFDINVKELSVTEKKWGILGCSLPWNSCYLTYRGMELDFLRQESRAYVSHQTVVVERSLLIQMKKFDARFRIAADTLMTMKLANFEPPLLLDGISIEVESGKTVTASNRRSRFETFVAVLLLPNNINKFIAMKNILIKEKKFGINRIKRFHNY